MGLARVQASGKQHYESHWHYHEAGNDAVGTNISVESVAID